MSEAFVIDDELFPDDKPPAVATTDSAPLMCQHEGCMNQVTKPARGRTPKFCDEHKSVSRAGASKLSGKSWPKAKEIETLLNQYIGGVSVGVGFLNPEDGIIIATKAPDVVHELVELAKDDKNLRRYLEYLATPGKYAPLTMACFALVFPILENHGIISGLIKSFTNREEG